MRIWVIEPGGWGGINQVAQYLTESLAQAGQDVLLITATDYEKVAALPEETVWPSIRWSRGRGFWRRTGLYVVLNVAWYVWALWLMYRRARAQRPSVVHLQGYYVPLLFWLTAAVFRRIGIPVVTTCHNTFLRNERSRGGWLARQGVRGLLATSDLVIIPAEEDVWNLQLTGFGRPERTEVIPLGWHPSRSFSQAEAREATGVPPGAFALGFVGYLRRDKGLDLVAEAVSQLSAECRSNLTVLVAGQDRGGLDIAKQWILAQHLESSFVLAIRYHSLDDMSRYLCASDVILLPYRQASDSGILRMAMAAGRPVIAAAVGVFPDVVRDAGNGWLFEPENASDLARTMERVMSQDGEELRARGEAGRLFAEQNYQWDRQADAHIRAYRRVAHAVS